MAKKNGTHDLDVTIQCPACHEYGVFHTWDVIDTADAKLSERVHFDENLFFYTCPHCHAKIHMESKCLYIDRDKKLLVWHIPDPKERVTSKEVQDALASPSFTTYTCRAALTWGEWREKIIELESSYDDRLYEIIKYGAYQLLSQEDKDRLPLEAYHIDYADDSHDPDKLALVFMQKDAKGMAYVYPITEHLKEVTKDIFLPIIEQIADANRKAQFDRFGYSWARQFTTYIIKAAEEDKNRETYGNLIGFWVKTIGDEIFRADVKPEE